MLLPGKFHEHRSWVGYSLWDRKESNMTVQLTFFHLHNEIQVHLFCPNWKIFLPLYGYMLCYAKSLQSCPDSVRPHRRQPTRLPRPWDSPGKNTGVGCHFRLQCMKVKSESVVAQSCPTPSDPMDCSPPGPSVHGIFQARVLEWVAMRQLKISHPIKKIPQVATETRCSQTNNKSAVETFKLKETIKATISSSSPL